MKKYAILAICLMLCTGVSARVEGKTYKIGVLMWRDTLDHEEGLAGFVSAMDASGLKYDLDVKKAHENQARIVEFLRGWQDAKVDMILTFGTTGARWAQAQTKGIPIVAIGCVADPVKYGIAESLERPGKGVTGTMNWVDPAEKLAVFSKCVPQMKRMGVVYDPCDIISSTEVAAMRVACESAGIVLKEGSVRDANGIEMAVGKLVEDGVDAMWVPTQTFIYQNMPKVIAATRPAKLPVLSSTLAGIGGENGNKDAAILAVTQDLRELGRVSVPSVVEILTSGKDAGSIPFKSIKSYEIAINARAAQGIGYEIPAILLSQANMVFRGFGGQKIVVAGTGDCQEMLRVMAHRLTDKLGEGEIVIPESVGSGGGIKALLKGEANLARVARTLKRSEKEQGLVYRSLGMAPVVFVVHEDVTGIDNITTEQIVGIYSGRITNWSELGGADGKIYPVTRESGDASLTVLQENIQGFADIKTVVTATFYSTPQAFDAISSHSGTIGFIAMPVVTGSRLKILKVDGVYPSEANILNGSYKFCIPLGLVYKGEAQGLTKGFLDFALSEDGMQIAARYGVVTVPQQL